MRPILRDDLTAFNKLELSLNEDYCGAAIRYQASSFYNVVLFNNEKALSWGFSATCFTKIMVVIWVAKPKGKCALL
jgi:hypothetical protein